MSNEQKQEMRLNDKEKSLYVTNKLSKEWGWIRVVPMLQVPLRGSIIVNSSGAIMLVINLLTLQFFVFFYSCSSKNLNVSFIVIYILKKSTSKYTIVKILYIISLTLLILWRNHNIILKKEVNLCLCTSYH